MMVDSWWKCGGNLDLKWATKICHICNIYFWSDQSGKPNDVVFLGLRWLRLWGVEKRISLPALPAFWAG
jgi:hypothetical protein